MDPEEQASVYHLSGSIAQSGLSKGMWQSMQENLRISPQKMNAIFAEASPKNAAHGALYNWASDYFGSGWIVDIGSELGFGLRQLVRSDRSVIGLDIQYASLTFSSSGNQDMVACYHLCGDGQTIPLQSGSVSGLCLINVLHLVDDPLRTLHESWRVLSAGGELIVTIPMDINLPEAWWNPSAMTYFENLLLGVFSKITFPFDKRQNTNLLHHSLSQTYHLGMLTAICIKL